MTIGNTYVLFTGECTGKKVVTRLVTLITGIHNSIARKEITLSMSKPHAQIQNSKILSLLFFSVGNARNSVGNEGIGNGGIGTPRASQNFEL